MPWVEPSHGFLGPGRRHGRGYMLAPWVLWGVNGSIQEVSRKEDCLARTVMMGMEA